MIHDLETDIKSNTIIPTNEIDRLILAAIAEQSH